jgi:hypothetical protein
LKLRLNLLHFALDAFNLGIDFLVVSPQSIHFLLQNLVFVLKSLHSLSLRSLLFNYVFASFVILPFHLVDFCRDSFDLLDFLLNFFSVRVFISYCYLLHSFLQLFNFPMAYIHDFSVICKLLMFYF